VKVRGANGAVVCATTTADNRREADTAAAQDTDVRTFMERLMPLGALPRKI
jgi:hypothetical protein